MLISVGVSIYKLVDIPSECRPHPDLNTTPTSPPFRPKPSRKVIPLNATLEPVAPRNTQFKFRMDCVVRRGSCLSDVTYITYTYE